MAILKRGRSKKLVLDIGTSAIRLCEISQTKAGYQLTKYFQRELSMDPAMDEEEKSEQREQVLQEMLKKAKIRTRKTILAVPGQSVFTRNRPLPPVPEYKVTQIVKYEIQQQIPFSLDEIALDYQVLNRTEVGGYDVMMAAIKVDVVDKHLEILKKVKRTINTVDVSPLAAYNWLRHTGEFGEDGQCVALVDLGATTTDIVIQKDNQFHFTRSLHIGGNDITKAIASAFNMSHDDAERLKREKGFAPTGDSKRDGQGGEVIGRVTGRMVGEINRSLAYFRSQPGGGPVTRVIVTGGGACLRNIIPYLQRQLNIEVRIAQPLAGLAIAPTANEASEHPEQACVALGLALRTVQDVPIQINLIPPRIQEIARQKEQALYWVLIFLTVYLIMASTIPVTAKKDEQVMLRIEKLRDVLARYDATIINDPEKTSDYEDQLNLIRTDVLGYKKEVEAMDRMKQNRTFWLPYLNEINDLRPSKGLAFSSIQTGVIGGVGNTGESGRLAMKNEAGGPSAEDNAAPAPPPAAAGPPGFGPPGFGGPPVGLAGRLGALTGINSSNTDSSVFDLTGFSGINDSRGGNTMGSGRGGGPPGFGGGGGPFGGGGPPGFGGGPPGGFPGGGGPPGLSRGTGSSGAASTINKGTGITEPNSIVLFGYAQNLPLLQNYVERLKSSDLFIDEGVYFHLSYLDDVFDTELDNANPGNVASNAAGGSSRGGTRGGGMGGGPFGMGGGPPGMGGGPPGMGGGPPGMGGGPPGGFPGGFSGGGGRGTAQRGVFPVWNINLIAFHIDVQFAGNAVEFTDDK